ncbi:MAG: serine hydroxymethyltransferase [Candidatus Xenolissoclinum pacificiensis L6]|uniref:Serine hydroxymethyltransferase n=1 Tax=Candidatus Xenolissoclinum pacificiensis L6 TaxID=1401685 RepID=W2V1T4_9RICK|nr:MAG: serine hydroxymethyltransferase [Candidatus Xenolissoclinum pacificiensis L6]
MNDFFLSRVWESDPEVAKIIEREYFRQKDTIDLIASENFVSQSVLDAFSIFTNKYAEGYPNGRYYGGCEHADEVELLAIDRAVKVFKYPYANVQVHSGSQANQAVFLACLEPGDTILGFSLDAGGHLTHGSRVNMSGKWFNAVTYGVRKDDYLIDMRQVESLALHHKPKLIIAGASAYTRHIDFARFREIADKVGSLLLADIAHYSGLIATDLYPSPYPFADVITTTTHKVLRGPRGGMIMAKDPGVMKRINSAVFPGMQGGPIMQAIVAKAVAFKELQSDNFTEYANSVLRNARSLATELIEKGFNLITGGTDSHMMLIDLTKQGITGKDAEFLLSQVGIICNKNTIPFDEKSPFITSGVRFGVAAVTTRRISQEHIKELAHIIYDTLVRRSSIDSLKARVMQITRDLQFYSADNILF